MRTKRVDRLSPDDVEALSSWGGGVVSITYRELRVLVTLETLKAAVEVGLELSHEERGKAVLSLNQALDRRVPLFQSGDLSGREAIEIAQDITLWYANEIIEERQTLPMVPMTREEITRFQENIHAADGDEAEPNTVRECGPNPD